MWEPLRRILKNIHIIKRLRNDKSPFLKELQNRSNRGLPILKGAFVKTVVSTLSLILELAITSFVLYSPANSSAEEPSWRAWKTKNQNHVFLRYFFYQKKYRDLKESWRARTFVFLRLKSGECIVAMFWRLFKKV